MRVLKRPHPGLKIFLRPIDLNPSLGLYAVIPPNLRGAFDQRHQTLGGERWPVGVSEIRRNKPTGGPSRSVPARLPRVTGA